MPAPPTSVLPRPVTPRTLLVVGTLAAVLLGGLSPAVAAPEDDYKLAVAHFKGKRYEAAVESFEEFLAAVRKDDPNLPTARFFLGLARINVEKYAEARRMLREYLRVHAKHEYIADARYQVAWCSYLLGEQEMAAREFASFIENHAKHKNVEWALVYLGDAQLQLDRAEEAAKSFRRSLDEHPKGAMAEDARMGLARAYELGEDYEKAVAEYRSVVDDPRSTRREEARFSLAGRLYDLDRFEESATEYDGFATAFADSELVPSARMNAGYAHFKAGDLTTAIERFDAAATDEKQAASARYWSALASRELGEYGAARTKFEKAFEAATDTPEAPNVLYQWADAEFLLGEYESAAKRFARVSDEWPEDPLGDDALHEAGNAALRAGDVNGAIRYVGTFGSRYGKDSPLYERQQVLIGRIELARGRPEDLQNAEKRLRIVVDETEDDATLEHARYELGRARFRLEDYAGVDEALAPLLERILESKDEASPYVEAFILQSTSLLERGEYEAADQAAANFLVLEPGSKQSARAAANRALARAHLGDRKVATRYLTELAKLDDETELPVRTRFAVAEIAYDAENFEWARDDYAAVTGVAGESSIAPAALTGLGWSQYQLKEFDNAAKTFQTFVARYGDDPTLGPEGRYMVGKALQDGGQAAEAATAFAECFAKYAPGTPAAAGAERTGSTQYAYKAGLQNARAHAEAGNVDEAHAAYAKVDATFPEAKGADLLLDEWALLNYDAGEYERSDTIFRRLVDDHPNSERADDARFHLAESANIAGRTDEAEKAFTALVQRKGVDEYVREHASFHLVEIAVAQRNWKDVLARATAFVKDFAKSEHSALATFRKGEAALQLDELGDASEALNEVLAYHADAAEEPWYDRVHVLLAEAAFRAKDHDAVEARVSAFRTASPESPFLYQADEVLGRSLKQRAGPKLELARAAFSRVVDDEHGARTETAAKAQFLLAETYLIGTTKDYKKAQREFFKVYVLYDFPEWQAVGLYQAARCDEALLDEDAARKAYASLVKEFPDSEYAAKAKPRLRALGGSD